MQSGQDCTTPQRPAKSTRSRTTAGERSQSSTETDICPLLSRSSKGTFTYSEDMNLPWQISRDWTPLTQSSQPTGSWSRSGAAALSPTSSIGSVPVPSPSMTSWYLAAKKMELQAAHHISSTLNRTRSARLGICRTKTLSISGLSSAKTARCTHTGTKMTMPTSTTWQTRPGPRNEDI